MNISNLCTRRVSIVATQTPLTDVAFRMREEHVGCFVVVRAEEGNPTVPIGVVTDRDVVVAVMARGAAIVESLVVGDLVTRPLVSARLGEDSLIVARRMREQGVRRLPVLDEEGALVGIVTADDLIGGLHTELHEIARLVTHQRQAEAARMG